jgi:hypothetical protein
MFIIQEDLVRVFEQYNNIIIIYVRTHFKQLILSMHIV